MQSQCQAPASYAGCMTIPETCSPIKGEGYTDWKAQNYCTHSQCSSSLDLEGNLSIPERRISATKLRACQQAGCRSWGSPGCTRPPRRLAMSHFVLLFTYSFIFAMEPRALHMYMLYHCPISPALGLFGFKSQKYVLLTSFWALEFGPQGS